jgi:hypothetical protein
VNPSPSQFFARIATKKPVERLAFRLSLCYCRVESKTGTIRRVRHWQSIAENLSNAGFSWGCSSESGSTGRLIYTAGAYARDGRRFTVLADERLTAFLELQAAIHRQLNE